MPDDVVRHLNFGEFIDLVAFLRDRKAQEELRGMVLTAWVVGPLDPDLAQALPVEKNPDPAEPILTPAKTRLEWKAIQADAAGKGFDLRPVLGQQPGSAYLLTYVYSPKEQKVPLLVQSEEGVRPSLNGERVETKADRATLELRAGWNTLLVRVGNKAGTRLQCRLLGGEGLRISLRKD
jgi:hypothetical protein